MILLYCAKFEEFIFYEFLKQWTFCGCGRINAAATAKGLMTVICGNSGEDPGGLHWLHLQPPLAASFFLPIHNDY